jgi:hypothetical protein
MSCLSSVLSDNGQEHRNMMQQHILVYININCDRMKFNLDGGMTCNMCLTNSFSLNSNKERCDRLVNTPVSCSGGTRLKYRPGDRLSRLKFFVVFLSPSSQIPGDDFKLGHDRILPHPFQFIIYLSFSRSTLYIV